MSGHTAAASRNLHRLLPSQYCSTPQHQRTSASFVSRIAAPPAQSHFVNSPRVSSSSSCYYSTRQLFSLPQETHKNANSKSKAPSFSIQKNNDFFHDFSDNTLFSDPFGSENDLRKKKWRILLDFGEKNGTSSTAVHTSSGHTSTAAAKDQSISLYEQSVNILKTAPAFMDYVDSIRHMSSQEDAADNKDKQEELLHMKEMMHKFSSAATDTEASEAAPRMEAHQWNLHDSSPLPPKFDTLRYVDVHHFPHVVKQMFKQSSPKEVSELVSVLPRIHPSFRDERNVASLIFGILRKESTFSSANLVWLRYAVAFRHLIQYLPKKSMVHRIYEKMLRIWSRLNYQWYHLACIRHIQQESKVSSSPHEMVNHIDLITERFLYIYTNSKYSPSLQALSFLAQSYAVRAESKKYLRLLKWMEENQITVPHKWKIHYLNECYISEGKFSSFENCSNQMEHTNFIRACVNANQVERAFHHIISNFDLNDTVRQVCLSQISAEYLEVHGSTIESKNKFPLTNIGLILSMIRATSDVDSALQLKSALLSREHLSRIPHYAPTEASTEILKRYIESYDVQGAEEYFRSTFDTPFKRGNEATVKASLITYEWMKRGAQLNAQSVFCEELDKLQQSVQHVDGYEHIWKREHERTD